MPNNYIFPISRPQPPQTTTAVKKFYDELPGIVTERMAQRQKEIINSRADEMLTWFCDAEIDDPDASTPVDDAAVDLGDQPCIGVASEGDPAVPLRRYSMDVTDVARTVALQVCVCQHGTTSRAWLPTTAFCFADDPRCQEFATPHHTHPWLTHPPPSP